MATGFERVRNVALATGALGAVAAGGALDQAAGAILALPQTVDAPSITNAIFRNNTAAAGLGTGFGISDVSTVATAETDYFNGAAVLNVNGTNFKDTDGQVDVSNATGALNTIFPGSKTITAEGKIGKVGVTAIIDLFAGTREIIRIRYIFKQTSKKKKKRAVTVRLGHDLGAASNIVTTSDGDGVLESGDAHMFTSQAGGEFTGFGFGDKNPGTHLQIADGGALSQLTEYKFTLKRRKAQTLLFFINVDGNNATLEAAPFATVAALNTANYLAGIPSGTKTINYNTTP